MVRTLATTASLALVLPSTLSFGGWVQQQQRPLGVVAPKQRLPPLRGLILPGDEGYDVLMPGAKGSEAEEDDEQDGEGGAAEGEDAAVADEEKSAFEGVLQKKVKEMNDMMTGSVWAKDRPAFGICAATAQPGEFVMGSELPQNPSAAADWKGLCDDAGVSRVLALFDDIDEEAEAEAAMGFLADAGFDASRVSLVFLSIDGAKDQVLSIIRDAKKAAVESSSGSGGGGAVGLDLGGLDLSGEGGDGLILSGLDGGGGGEGDGGIIIGSDLEGGLAGSAGSQAGGEKVVVACQDGATLTSLALGAYVMDELSVNPEEAVALLRARVKFSGVADRVPQIESLGAFVQHGRTGEALTDESLGEFVMTDDLREQDDGVTGAAYVPVTEAGKREAAEAAAEAAKQDLQQGTGAAPETTTTPGGLIL